MKKESFLKGAFILAIAGLLVKVLGAFFRIPLGNIITSEGMAYYSTPYPLYVMLLVISTAGFPTAISKLVAEKTACGDKKGAHRIFTIAFKTLLVIGVITSLLLFFGARIMVDVWFKNPKAFYSMRALAPALLFVSVMSAYRGYFQGMQNMKPTAISQLIEQIFRVFLGLYLAFVLLGKGKEIAAAGASFGATVGSIFGALFMIGVYYLNRGYIKNNIKKQKQAFPEEKTSSVIKEILKIAIPITIGAAVIPVMNLIDTGLVMRRLLEAGFSKTQAASLFGQLNGMAITLVNLPQVITMALSMSLVPMISQSIAMNDRQKAKDSTNMALKVSSIISFPSAIGLAVLAVPIMKLLFPKEPSSVGQTLFVLATGVVFLCTIQTLTGIFQGMGKPIIPVINLFIGAIFKIAISYSLTGIKSINVKGAALGTVVAYLVAAVLNYIMLQKEMDTKFCKKEIFIKPLIASAAMGLVAKIVYEIVAKFTSNTIGTVVAILIGMIVYTILLFVIKIITIEELEQIPKGKKIAKLLKR